MPHGPVFIDHIEHHPGQRKVYQQKNPAAGAIMRQLLPHLLAGLVTQRMPHEEKAHGRQRCIVSGQRIEPRGPVIDAKAQLQRAVCTVPQGASGEGHIGPKPDVAGQVGIDKPVNVAVSPQSSRFAGAPDQTMPVGSEFRPAKVLPQAKRLYAAQRRCHGRLASLIS